MSFSCTRSDVCYSKKRSEKSCDYESKLFLCFPTLSICLVSSVTQTLTVDFTSLSLEDADNGLILWVEEGYRKCRNFLLPYTANHVVEHDSLH